jgi:hypothetical protein
MWGYVSIRNRGWKYPACTHSAHRHSSGKRPVGMLLDILTILFIVAGCLLLWFNLRPRGLKMRHEQKSTLGEMRATGATQLLVYCGDYKCGHSVALDAALWPDNVRLSDLEVFFVCQVCGHQGADVRPLFEPPKMGTGA